MKKLIAILLAFMLLLTACGSSPAGGQTSEATEEDSIGQIQEEPGELPQDQEEAEAPSQAEPAASAENQDNGGKSLPGVGKGLSAQAKMFLEQITYYGDWSKCTISRDQMEAYAQLLKSFDYSQWGINEELVCDAFLADLDGTGNPYLVLVHPALGLGAYAPTGFSYVDGQVNCVCDCWDGSASGGYLTKMKNGRVLYVEWEDLDTTGCHYNQAYEYYMISNGGLVETADPGEEDYGEEGVSPTLSQLCYPGWKDSQLCTDVEDMITALQLALKDISSSQRAQMAAAMLSELLFPHSDTIMQARLMDLDGNGMEELFVLTGEGTLYYWQDGALQSKTVGRYAGGSLNWYLCRDPQTGELGIEYESIGGGDFSGGSRTYYYLSHTVEISDINDQYRVNGQEATRAQYDQVAADNPRVEDLIDWDQNGMPAENHCDETVERLMSMLSV